MAAGWVEEDLLDASGEGGLGEELGQVVDEMRAALLGDAREFALFRLIEMDIPVAKTRLGP